jgi:glycerophosphoryl diester phosphodiesterase
VEVQGHRGCRGLLPENTLPGFREAIRLGVDVLELDLGLSADGVLVVAHDPRLNPVICSGLEALPSPWIKELTYAQLGSLDCGSKRHPDFPQQRPAPGARMPRLEQVLELLRAHPGLRANIEIKTFPERPQETRPPADFAAALVAAVRDAGLQQRVTVQSFDPVALQAVARLEPGLTLAALAERREDFDPMLRRTGARILSPRHSEIRRRDVDRYRESGVRVIPWTVNTVPEMKRLLEWGVDGIITDRPDLLLELLNSPQ